MKKMVLVATLISATAAFAQTAIIPPAGFQAEKMNACRQFGEMSADTYSTVNSMSKPTERVWSAARDIHPVVTRVVDAMRAGRVHDRQAAYTLGIAYCYDYIDEQAAKPRDEQGKRSITSSPKPDTGNYQTSKSPPSPESERACQYFEKAADYAFSGRQSGASYETLMAAANSVDAEVGKAFAAYAVRAAFRHNSSAEAQRDVKEKCIANLAQLVQMQLGGMKSLSVPD